MKNPIIISEPVFKSAVHLFINQSYDQVNEFYKKAGMDVIPDEYRGSLGLCFRQEHARTKVKYYSIILPDFDWTIKGQSTLVHELSHFIYMQIAEKGIEEINMNETFSYLLEYYFLESSRAINKLTDKQMPKQIKAPKPTAKKPMKKKGSCKK